MNRPSLLYHLQKIDTQLDRHRHRQREIAALLADATEARQAEGRVESAAEALSKVTKELRSAEEKVKDQRLKIQLIEASLYGGKIRNPKELQGLQEEAEALKRFLGVLEDRQLECMLALDEVKEHHRAAQDALARTRQKIERLHAHLNAEQARLEEEVRALEGDRINRAGAILADDLALYERLRKGRAGVAVSRVNERACASCGATLTAALHQAARSPSQITHCETCGRILYVTEQP